MSEPPIPEDLPGLRAGEKLDDERRRRIDLAHERLVGASHYEVLELSSDAAVEAVRKAYFELSREFHPDTAFGHNAGSIKSKMEELFKAITAAYQTLISDASRATYDRYLATRRVNEVARELLDVPLKTEEAPSGDAGVADEALRSRRRTTTARSVRLSSSPPRRRTVTLEAKDADPSEAASPSQPAPLSAGAGAFRSKEAEARARHLGAKRLLAASGRGRARSDVQGVATDLQVSEPAVQADGLFRKAQQAAQSADWLSAVRLLAQASALDSERMEISIAYRDARQKLASQLADQNARQATYESEQGQWTLAALSWARVCEGRPDDIAATKKAAEAFLKAARDFRRARHFAQRAVDLVPDDVEALCLLVRALIAEGFKRNAEKQLRLAARLAPRAPEVRALLKEFESLR